MKFRKLVVLLAVLAVLATLAITKKASMDRRVRMEPKAPVLETVNPGLSTAFVSKITLSGPGEPAQRLEIEKKGAEWFMSTHYGARARRDQVEKLLTDISTLAGEVRAEKKELLSDFSLSAEQAFHVELIGSDGKQLSHTLISPQRPNRGQNFVSAHGTEKVFAVATDVLSTLGIWDKDSKLDFKTFVDWQVASLVPDAVSRLELAAGSGGDFSLVRQEGEKADWVFDPPDAQMSVDADKVKAYMAQLSNLYGRDILDPKTSPVVGEKPKIRWSQKDDPQGLAHEIYWGAETLDKTVPLKLAPEGIFYSIQSSSLGQLKKDKAHFQKAAA